jgi:hypothetical protein
MDFAREYIAKVEAMSGGRVTIDLCLAGFTRVAGRNCTAS